MCTLLSWVEHKRAFKHFSNGRYMVTIRRLKSTKGTHTIILASIANDIAGATDLCFVLAGHGVYPAQENSVPR